MDAATPALLGTLQGILLGGLVVLSLFIGFCVLFNLSKVRPSGRHSRVVRGLTEVIGGTEVFLPPDAPRGQVDQLRTPELLEKAARKSA